MARLKVSRNKIVSLTYTVTDEQGGLLERVDLPVTYMQGRDSGLFEQIEEALEGKQVGDLVSVTLSPEDGFGERDPSMTFSDAIENVPPDYRYVGAQAEFVNEQGDAVTMVVTHVDERSVTLDGNHPFAGKVVTFHVTITEIREPTPQEMLDGDVAHSSPTLQ